MNLYLIKRGPRPSYHKAPFHPVVLCCKKRLAKIEAGCTGDRAWVWDRDSHLMNGLGFLLVRWEGLDIDYGHIVRHFVLPDGTKTGFHHSESEPFQLLNGAVWWDSKPIPDCLSKRGVIYPPDDHTQQTILDQIANDGCSGFGRPVPSHWKAAERLGVASK